MKDSKGKEIKKGDVVLFSTWGMFGVHESHWKNTERFEIGYTTCRRPYDPEYVTHLDIGTVEEILKEEDGTLHVHPLGYSTGSVIHICMKPSWTSRGEYVEVVN